MSTVDPTEPRPPSELDAEDQQVINPVLTDEQLTGLSRYGVAQEVGAGDALFRVGDAAYDLIVVERGLVELVRPAMRDSPEAVVVRVGPGQFIGELNLLTGAAVILDGRVSEAGLVRRISPESLRRLMAEEVDLSDVLLRTFIARRQRLQGSSVSHTLDIIGSGASAATLALRTYAARLRLTHRWRDTDSVTGQELMRATALEPADLPAIITPARTLRRATPGDLAQHLGLSFRRADGRATDLTVIGAGPAGLAAALYGASEGLHTVVLDAVGPGGQAATSARIENYLGFPSGVSGNELTALASVQALKFGAQISTPCRIIGLDGGDTQLRVLLESGSEILTRAVVIATGASYRSLPIDRWDDFVGAGIFYAATEIEARGCSGEPVTVVGGANSAGQAALFLASRGCQVTVVIRGTDIRSKMSAYLVDRLLAHGSVTVRTATEVTALHGDLHLEEVELTDALGGQPQPCRGLFCFIGARPATEWLTGVSTDEAGFLRTDVNLRPEDLGPTWVALGRAPLPFETSLPAVFAAGDVRRGSMKRVASAVGEGASAVRSVHTAIGVRA